MLYFKESSFISYLKKILFFSFIILMTVSAGAAVNLEAECENDDEKVEESLLSYFPAYVNMVYEFAGEGIEFASFNRKIYFTKAEGTYIQTHENNGGTETVSLYKREPGQILLLYQESEFYEKKNILNEIEEKKAAEPLIILKTPLQQGKKWETRGQLREITGVDQTITTPGGTFHKVIEVKIENIKSKSTFITYEYYAPNIGLIFRKSISKKGYIISSSLKSFGIKEK